MKQLIGKWFTITAALFLITVHFQMTAYSQTEPLTIDQISRAISKVGKDKTLLRKILNDVRGRGLDFLLFNRHYLK
ncbi:MAG: hypothetical protein LH614_13035 [Pyrinomonadaceae bacterium]|nr:hypothetical protein [Pyrinomonadaceae bacterium]